MSDKIELYPQAKWDNREVNRCSELSQTIIAIGIFVIIGASLMFLYFSPDTSELRSKERMKTMEIEMKKLEIQLQRESKL